MAGQATVKDIDAQQWYGLAEAAKFIPSSHGGCIHVRTLLRWKQKGRIRCEPIGQGLFVRGAEILRILHDPAFAEH